MIDCEILQDIITDHDLCGVQKRELLKTIAMIKQGRLKELPCAEGDTVWMVIDNRDFKRRMKDYCPSAEELPELNIAEHNFSLLLLSSIGKTVFLTKEEAERKLKELENE